MQIRGMINSQAKRGTNYCVRVTADDGNDGEEQLRKFQEKEKQFQLYLQPHRNFRLVQMLRMFAILF